MPHILAYFALFLGTGMYAVLLNALQPTIARYQLWWLATIPGVAACLGTVELLALHDHALSAAWHVCRPVVWSAFAVAAVPIIIWRVWRVIRHLESALSEATRYGQP